MRNRDYDAIAAQADEAFLLDGFSERRVLDFVQRFFFTKRPYAWLIAS